MLHRSLGHRAPLLWLVLPLAGGLIAGRMGEIAPVVWQLAGALVAAGVALWASGRNSHAWHAGICVAMVLAGSASYALHRARMPEWDRLPPREAHLTLHIDRVFSPPDPRKTTGLATVLRAEAHLRELSGQKLYFALALHKNELPPTRSAVISCVGVLVALPRSPASDSFEGYLAGAGINFRLNRGRVLATEQPAAAYYRFCGQAAMRFAEILNLGVAEKRPDLAAILRAMMLGQKHELSEEHDALFMRSGTMHLFAISGLHISAIAVALHALLTLMRLPRIIRFVVELAALWLYVDITGAAASAVRAFIMVTLVESSLLLRVPGNPIAALAASALVVLLLWPMQLFSASFQMSYGIVAALLLLGLPLSEAWLERWQLYPDLPASAWNWRQRTCDGFRRALLPAIAIGAAATLVSTISGVLFFKLFTPGSIVANLVLIPTSMVVMWAGLASLLCGLVGASALSALFNHAGTLVLWLIDAGVRALVSVPGAWCPAAFSAAWIGPATLIALLAALIAGYACGWKRSRGRWWPPFAIVVIALAFGTRFG